MPTAPIYVPSSTISQRNQMFREAGWPYHYYFSGRFEFDLVVPWAEQHIGLRGQRFTFAGPNWWFRKEKDYLMFVLRWS